MDRVRTEIPPGELPDEDFLTITAKEVVATLISHMSAEWEMDVTPSEIQHKAMELCVANIKHDHELNKETVKRLALGMVPEGEVSKHHSYSNLDKVLTTIYEEHN